VPPEAWGPANRRRTGPGRCRLRRRRAPGSGRQLRADSRVRRSGRRPVPPTLRQPGRRIAPGERILENLELVQLTPSEWAERWERRLKEPGSSLPGAAQWHLNQLITPRPDDGALYAERGRIRLRMGRRKAARDDFDRVLALGTEPRWVRIERGTIQAREGLWKAAAEDHSRAADLKSEDPLTRYYLALTLLADGDREGYRKSCSAAWERFGKGEDNGAVDRLGYTCVAGPAAIADPSGLVRLLELTLLQGKTHPRLLADARYRAGQPEKALETFEESSKIFTPLTWDHLFLAMVHHSVGQADEARRHLAEATRWIDGHDRDQVGSVWPD
jgi:tetratricopeptide (TPR) repeat protein